MLGLVLLKGKVILRVRVPLSPAEHIHFPSHSHKKCHHAWQFANFSPQSQGYTKVGFATQLMCACCPVFLSPLAQQPPPTRTASFFFLRISGVWTTLFFLSNSFFSTCTCTRRKIFDFFGKISPFSFLQLKYFVVFFFCIFGVRAFFFGGEVGGLSMGSIVAIHFFSSQPQWDRNYCHHAWQWG